MAQTETAAIVFENLGCARLNLSLL